MQSNPHGANNSHAPEFFIDGKKYSWNNQFITGTELRQLAAIPGDKNIYLVGKGTSEDQLISDETSVDLNSPGIEQFVTKEKSKKFEIIVNGRKKEWLNETISFWDLVKLAFPNAADNNRTVYTVTYDKGPKENPKGTMSNGDSVYVKNNMVFNVTGTDKS